MLKGSPTSAAISISLHTRPEDGFCAAVLEDTRTHQQEEIGEPSLKKQSTSGSVSEVDQRHLANGDREGECCINSLEEVVWQSSAILEAAGDGKRLKRDDDESEGIASASSFITPEDKKELKQDQSLFLLNLCSSRPSDYSEEIIKERRSSFVETRHENHDDVHHQSDAAVAIETDESGRGKVTTGDDSFTSSQSGNSSKLKAVYDDFLRQTVGVYSYPSLKSSQTDETASCDVTAVAIATEEIGRNDDLSGNLISTAPMLLYNLKNQSLLSRETTNAMIGSPATTTTTTNSGRATTMFQCNACQKEFATEKYLCMHMALHRSQLQVPATDVTNKPKNYSISKECPSGGQRAASTTDEPSSTSSVKLIKADGTGASHWTCMICSKSFAQSSNYKNHIRTHSDERPFVCNVCSIGFKEKYHLKKHILFKHSDELKEECRVCGKRFKDSTAVRAHERIHSEDRPYGCQRCDKTFKTSECLWHHENRSRTCGKSTKGGEEGPGGVAGGGKALDSNGRIVQRFRRGRQPGRRSANKGRERERVESRLTMMGEMSSTCLSLDHVEEISASVKVELEREIMREHFFKCAPNAIYAYSEYNDIIDALTTDGQLTLRDQDVTFPPSNVVLSDETMMEGQQQNYSESAPYLEDKSPGTFPGHLDLMASFWSSDWTTSNGAGVLLESLSRPVSASYDSSVEVNCSETSADKTWKQNLSNFRHVLWPSSSSSSSFAGQQHHHLNESDVVVVNNVSHFSAGQNKICSSSSSAVIPRSSLPQLQLTLSVSTNGRKSEPEKQESVEGGGTNQVVTSCLPTAIVAPIKRENASCRVQQANVTCTVSASSTNNKTQDAVELQPIVKNSLPPFETFAPITLRVQNPQQPMTTSIVTYGNFNYNPPPLPPSSLPPPSYIPPPPPPPSPHLPRHLHCDGSIANQCPTIQKYLLRGHPNIWIRQRPGQEFRNIMHPTSHSRHHPRPQSYPMTTTKTTVSPSNFAQPIEMAGHMMNGRHLIGSEFNGFTTNCTPDGAAFVGTTESQQDFSGFSPVIDQTTNNLAYSLNSKLAAFSYSQSTMLQPLLEVEPNNMAANFHRHY